jgi:NADPH:quinone reductase-like Zn-dependent oxidoreductase
MGFSVFVKMLNLRLRERAAEPVQLRLGISSVSSKKEAMAVLSEHLAAGKITPIIDSTYPLSKAGQALRHMIEDELHGKVIVVPSEAV